MKEIYIDRGITQSRAALFNDGELLNLYIENVDFTSINGNIYIGRIENIVPGLNAAFINIGIGKNAILHFDNEDRLKGIKRGQDVLVQVIREGIGNKGPRVSEEISIPGKYVVLLPGNNYIGVSHKIEDASERKKLKKLMNDICEDGYGVIVRTESKDIQEDELVSDYMTLKEMWMDVEKKLQYIKAPHILFNSKDFYEYIIREYISGDIDKIYLNREADLNYVSDKLRKIDKNFTKKITFDGFNFTLQGVIEREIEKANERKISLPSGGEIVIDHTEAFTCIDVNTGNFVGEQNSEDTIFNVNIEACKEISRAIKLRNISGIILIDFIDMKSEKNKDNIINIFENEFKDDKSRLKVYGFTKLGILETARAKKGIRISEFIYSDGDKRLTPSYCLKIIENKCLKAFKHYNKNNFNVYVSQLIYNEIQNIVASFIYEMKNIYGIEININKCENTNTFYIENEGNKS